MSKICSKCKKEKDDSHFIKNDAKCYECRSEYLKQYREKNKEYLKQKNKEYREKNKEKLREKDKERRKEYYKKNKEKILESQKEYYRNNPENRKESVDKYNNSDRRREKNKEWARNKRKKDISFRLRESVSANIRNKVKRKKETTDKYVDINEIIKVLEEQFDDKMNWDNYGTYWEIDHIIPQSFYDFEKEEEIKKCWSLKNLRPLPKSENASKSNALVQTLVEEKDLFDILPQE